MLDPATRRYPFPVRFFVESNFFSVVSENPKRMKVSSAFLVISTIACAIFQTLFFYPFAAAACGFSIGSLVKNGFSHYDSLQLFERKVLTLERRAPCVRHIVGCVALIFSYWLPLLAVSLGLAYGLWNAFAFSHFLSQNKEP
jgi:hypothetical protein